MKYLSIVILFFLVGCFPSTNTTKPAYSAEPELKSKYSELLREAIRSGCDPKEIKVSKSVREDAMNIRCKD